MAVRKQRDTGRRIQWWLAVLGVSLMLFLSACGSLTPKGQSASQEKARLDKQIQQALNIGVPSNMLDPIRQQEARIAGQLPSPGLFGDKNPDSAYVDAINSYKVLEGNVATVVAQATNQARFQAHQDIQTFDALLQQRQNQGFKKEVPGYQSRLQQVEQQFNAGVTPNDFAKISATAKQQTEALQLLWPTYQQLQSLQDSITQMKKAGLNIALGQQEYQDDLAQFQAASMPQDYRNLMTTINAHLNQLATDQVAAIPFIGAAMLNNFQELIDQAQTYGVDVTTYQQQLAQDRQELAGAHNLPAYLSLSSRIKSQMANMQTVLIKGKTNYDLKQLQDLITTTDIKNDYEYRDGTDGYGDQSYYLKYANSTDDYESIDNQLVILLANLHALLTNMNDKTAHNLPHATDLQLMQQYQLMTGRVVVVSLTEQTIRTYQDGQLVKSWPIVTGQMAAPTPPGLWHVFYMGTNLTFHSSEPPDSPLWYPPTPINYGMEYHWGGFYLHDATWRSYFGPGANLPHPDYTSGQYSDTGSHGCINMTVANTAWLYDWVSIGTPVLVY